MIQVSVWKYMNYLSDEVKSYYGKDGYIDPEYKALLSKLNETSKWREEK